MIGIIVADENEISKFDFPLKEKKIIGQFTFNIFDIDSKEVVLVHSGIGIANAAAATQELISSLNVKEIYNYGAVGGDKTLEVFDLIAPKKIYYHDVITPWYKRGQTPGENEYYYNNISLKKNNNLASGSSFLADYKVIEDIQRDLDVNIFDMETSAMAQIAHKNNIPLNVIKCVSDLVGKDSTKLGDINSRIEKAGLIAFNKTIELIRK